MNCLKFKTIKRNRNNNVAVLHARLYRHRSRCLRYLIPQNIDQPEVRLSWKLVPFFSMRMSKIRHFDAILASSPGTFDH